MNLIRASLLACPLTIFRVDSTQPELPTLGHSAPMEWFDEWSNKHGTAAMLENPSLSAHSSTVQATQKGQKASWGDDPYRIRQIRGKFIPPSTQCPPTYPHPGPKVLGAHSQTNHELGTNTHALVGDEPDPGDLQTITNQLTNGPKGQDSREHLISLSLSSAAKFMPHSSYINLASGLSHILQVTETSQQPSLKTSPPQSHQRSRQRIPTLKPSPKPLKKQTPRAKEIWPKNSSGPSETSHLALIEKLTLRHGALKFDMGLFEDVSPRCVVQNPARGDFKRPIEYLPGKLLTIPEDKFEATYVKYIWRGRTQPDGNVRYPPGVRTKFLEDRLLEFKGDMELWYRRWHMITSFDFKKGRPLPYTGSGKMGEVVEVVFCSYLFYVEMICSIVPRESTTSRDLETELKSARDSFAILSSDTNELLAKRLVKDPNERWNRYYFPLLWTYLGHWMRNERPGVFKLDEEGDIVIGIKNFFNSAFAFSYSAVARKYIFKDKISPA